MSSSIYKVGHKRFNNYFEWPIYTYCTIVAEEEPTIVIQQMPTLSNKQQPSIAVITSNYYEKLAVDAMMEDKTTYVKFQAVGTSYYSYFYE